MAETLRELVVALSLDSSNFSRNMRTINQQIKEAESTFRLAGAGVENYEKTIAGTESKLSMLGQKLTQQQRAVEQYSRALVAANDKLKENYNRHQDYTQRLEQAKARQEDLRFEVEAATVAYENYRDSLGETDSATIAAKQNLERYQEEYADATAEVTKLEGQVKALQKTMQNSADAVSKATTDLNNAKAAVKDTEAEIRRLTEQLYRMQSAWTQAGESLTAISKKCETISKAMTKAGKSLTTHVTAPITALGTAAVKASIDYEYAFADVRKTVDATEEEYNALSDSVKKMSTEVGYAYIAKELDISLNTVKAFCRRNDLAGNRSTTDTQPEKISVSSQKVDLIRADSRVNSTTAKQPRALENTGLSDDSPVCEVTVSYADEPDLGAVADVLDLLTHANYGR